MNSAAFINSRPAILLNGELNAAMQQALNSMVVNLPLSGCAHAELVLNNFAVASEGPEFLFASLRLGAELTLQLGPEQTRLFSGEITALEERYGEGAPQLIVLLQDKLHRLARRRNSRVFEDQSPDDIVSRIAGDAGLDSDIQISQLSADFHQLNESDLAFLSRLLGNFGMALRLESNVLRARPETADPEPIALNAQDSVLSVRLIADLNHQYASTRVLGFNAGSDEPVTAQGDALSPPPQGTTAAETLGELGWPAEELVAQPFPRTSGEAEAFAQAHFARGAGRFISGELRCQAEPALRSGREIDLSGVSERMAGKYRVVHCAHRFDAVAGFETHLKVNRGGWNP